MNFQDLVAKMQEIDLTPATEAQVDVPVDENCGDMPPSMPPKPEDKASMNVNISAQGDAIEDILALMAKVNPDSVRHNDGGEQPSMPMPMPIDIKPINKMLPGDDGEEGPMDSPMDIKKLALDKDGDEEEKDSKEAWANEPDEDERDTSYQMTKLQGGMNRRKGTHPKVAGGDNPMQKVGEADLVSSIRAQLQQALAEVKGEK